MSSGNESDDEPMSAKILEDICDGSKSHPIIDRIETRYRICDRIKRSEQKWKRALLSTQNMVKGLQKV